MTIDVAVDHDIVVSAENNDFMAWQCLVFHHSCITTIGRTPIVVVHGDEPDLAPGFARLEKTGGLIQRAPNFRHHDPIMYAPWNQVMTTGLVDSDASWLVFADTDMIFLDAVDFSSQLAQMSDRTVGLDHIPFLVVHETNRPVVAAACEHFGVDLLRMESQPVNGATPYLISNSVRAELCAMWQETTRFYLRAAYEFHGGYDPGVWVSSMWGLALAIHALGLDFELTERCVHTIDDPAIRPTEQPIVHYSYRNDAFDKRRYHDRARLAELWTVQGRLGHTSGAVCDAIRAAGAHYGLAEGSAA